MTAAVSVPAGRSSSPLLAVPGAVAADGADVGVAWHYGDPIAEQRAAEHGAVQIDHSHRDLITVTGADRLTWLHTLTSQSLTGLADGAVTQALILSPQGHVEHQMGVAVLGDTIYLDTEPSRGPALLAYLSRMVFWSEVTPTDVSARWSALAVIGPTAAPVLRASALPADPMSAQAIPGGGLVAPRGSGFALVSPRHSLFDVAMRLSAGGARPAGSWADEALRIADRRPRFGLDTDDRTIPNELPWLGTAVHLHKGCYRGQETVARVANLGRPPRRLALLHLDGSADRLPQLGSELLTAQGRVVGRVGSSAHHHEDGPIALALVKRSVPADTPLLADGVDAALDPVDFVDDGTGVPASVIDRRALPDLRRR